MNSFAFETLLALHSIVNLVNLTISSSIFLKVYPKNSFLKCSHSSTKYNRDNKAPLRRLDFKGFFELLDRNSNDNTFVFVLEKLDKDDLKHQFDNHNVNCNCHIRDGELGKFLTPIVEELYMCGKANFEIYNTRLENRLACNIYHCYKWQDIETGFDCYHYYHGECLENWKAYHIDKNEGITKTIKCSSCQSNIREKYDNVYTCEWKVDGSGSMWSSDARIEVIDIENLGDVEITDTSNTPNFKEQQNIAITRYNHLHKVEQESFQNYMKNNTMKCQVPETKHQSSRIIMEPDKYVPNKLTVKHLLFRNFFYPQWVYIPLIIR